MGTNSPRSAREVAMADALFDRFGDWAEDHGFTRDLFPYLAVGVLDALSTEGWEVRRANPTTGEGTE